MSENDNATDTPPTSSPYSMTEDVLEKRLHRPNCGRVPTQLFAGFLAWLSAVSFGTTLGWSSAITHHMFITEDEASPGHKKFAWLVSMVPLGCSLGITTSTFLMKQMGPKKALVVLTPFYILNWCVMLIPNVDVQLSGRFFLGVLGVSYLICGENLFQQTVHYAIKRYVSVFHNSAILIGVLIGHIVGTAIPMFWLTVLCATIPMLHFLLIHVVPESPVFLYATSHSAATKSLAWYRGANNIYLDMAQIKKDWDATRQDTAAYKYMMYSKVVYKGILIVIGVTFFQVFSGYYIFLFYSVYLWNNEHIITTPIVDSAIVSTCFVISKIVWSSLHSAFSWKIRGLLIASCFMSAVELTMLSAYLFFDSLQPPQFTTNVRWLPLPIFAMYLIFYDMGLNHYPKILIFQYMPFQVFKRAYSIVMSLFWIFNFLNIFGFASLRLVFPSYVTFIIMAGFSYVGTLFCYLFVIEPKGKSLIQVQLDIGGNPIGKRGALYNQSKQNV